MFVYARKMSAMGPMGTFTQASGQMFFAITDDHLVSFLSYSHFRPINHVCTHTHTHKCTLRWPLSDTLKKSGCFVASFAQCGETLRGDEVREMECRDGKRREPNRGNNRESSCASLCSYSHEIPLQGLKHSYIRCIITCSISQRADHKTVSWEQRRNNWTVVRIRGVLTFAGS